MSRVEVKARCGLGVPWDFVELPSQILDLLHRAIGCGAIIDPWNIIGFDANFSLFPAMENSIHDHRADELMLTGNIFDHSARLRSFELAAAAARD